VIVFLEIDLRAECKDDSSIPVRRHASSTRYFISLIVGKFWKDTTERIQRETQIRKKRQIDHPLEENIFFKELTKKSPHKCHSKVTLPCISEGPVRLLKEALRLE